MTELFVAKLGDFKEGDRRIVRSPQGEIGVFHHAGAFQSLQLLIRRLARLRVGLAMISRESQGL